MYLLRYVENIKPKMLASVQDTDFNASHAANLGALYGCE
jgi:hypothetical protein